MNERILEIEGGSYDAENNLNAKKWKWAERNGHYLGLDGDITIELVVIRKAVEGMSAFGSEVQIAPQLMLFFNRDTMGTCQTLSGKH